MKKLIFLVLVISFSFAYFMDGNRLYQNGLEYHKNLMGEKSSWVDVGLYDGYVMGVFDSYNGVLFCSPINVTSGQVFDIVFKYLQNYPENRNLSANTLVFKALNKIWPCKKK